jgi:hypothetical protein
MASLITPAYFNAQMNTLGLKSSFTPTLENLDTLITEASDWVENYCDRKFELQDTVEVVRGPIRSNRRLVLPDFPVNSVASIAWVDDNNTSGTEDATAVRILQGGVLEFKNSTTGAFLYERLYTVTYNTGFSTIPSNVQRATALKIADLLQPQYQGPQEREIFMVSNIEGMIVDLLEPYRRERLG